jgi:hypothetical protein
MPDQRKTPNRGGQSDHVKKERQTGGLFLRPSPESYSKPVKKTEAEHDEKLCSDPTGDTYQAPCERASMTLPCQLTHYFRDAIEEKIEFDHVVLNCAAILSHERGSSL